MEDSVVAMIQCKECRTEISSKAKTCPKCGTKLRGRFKGILMVVFGFMLFGTCVSALDGGKSKSTSGKKAEQGTVQPRELHVKLGEEFKLGAFAYLVSSTRVTKSVGSGFTREKASDGAKYLVVDYRITNQGKETATVLSDDMKFIDPQGREFKPSSRATTALLMAGKTKDYLLSQLQPGIQKKTKTVFEVPAAIKKGKLVVKEKGFLGVNEVLIHTSLE